MPLITMNISPENSANLYFLSDGGEMGELIRTHDWSQSSLDTPHNWPLSLRSLLGVVLHSSSPMVLFWGDDLICFYNDAYRPTLGHDRHPAIGKKAEDIFPESWDFIRPVLMGVKETGKPVKYEDLLIPVFRNGKTEDVYWTFSYSPAFGDNGSINGVFIHCIETTETVTIRKTLVENDSLFRTLSEGTNILIAASDENRNGIFFNNAWKKLTGHTLEELKGIGWTKLLHPNDKDFFLATYKNAFESKTSFTGECRLLSATGSYRWLLVTATPRFDNSGNFAGYLSSTIDITERKEAEEKFIISSDRLHSVVSSAPFPIGVYLGREMRIALVNQAIIDVWGKGSDVINKTYFEVLPELENQGIYPKLQNVFDTGQPYHARNQRVDIIVNGELQPYYFNYSFTPLFDTEGNVYGVMNTAADVTDLTLATLQVAQSEKNFRSLILQAPVAMCLLLGPEHVVEVANEAIVELWGKPQEEVMYRPIFEGLPDAREQGLEELLNNVYVTGETSRANEMPVQLVRFGHTETIYQNFVYQPYKDSEGQILGVIAITIDVTSQVQARQRIEEIVKERTQELEQANNNLKKSNAELAQFAYIASHDLQEPLRKIRVFSQMLEARISPSLDEQSRNYMGKIQSASERMQALIRDVLTYSELVKDHEVFDKVDLNKTLNEIVSDYELLIEQKGASVLFTNLPVIEAIPLQMTQLFSNLVSNSLKFSKAGVHPVIKLSAEKMTQADAASAGLNTGRSYYLFRYSDNGIGFKPEYSERIFNIFQRLHGKSEYEGTGIGLAMCKKIALNHLGDLNANGSSENGAVFNIFLPVTHF